MKSNTPSPKNPKNLKKDPKSEDSLELKDSLELENSLEPITSLEPIISLEPNSNPEKKSKSQIKREYLALQALGKSLLALSPKQLKQLPLNEKLLIEITAAKHFKKAALKRQLQYIGSLLDSEPLEPQLIQQKLQELIKPGKDATRKLHQVEAWREQLIDGDQQLLEELCESHMGLDFQQLRQLIRNAQKERSCNQSPRAQRKLFRLLNELGDPSQH